MKEKVFKILQEKKMLLTVFITVFVFGFLAHSYGIFNPSFSVDSLVIDLDADMSWQYSIGRIIQPFYRRIFGVVAVPFLSQVLWMTFLALAIYYITKIFKINNYLLVVLLCGILTTCASTVYSTIYHFQWNEIFSLALFLSVLSVYLIRKYKYGYILGGGINFIVLGLYQSFICATIGLVIITAIIDVIQGKDIKKSIVYLLKIAISLICGAILYLLTVKVLEKTGVMTVTEGYNAVGAVKIQSPKRYIVLTIKAYYLFVRNIIFSSTYVDFSITLLGAQEIFSAILFLLVVITSIYYFVKIVKQKQIPMAKVAYSILLVACLPFGFALICLFSDGLGNLNVHYQGFLIYVLPIVLYQIYSEGCETEKESYSLKKIATIGGVFAVGVIGALAVAFLFFKRNLAIKNFACQSVIFLLIPIYLFAKFKKSKVEKTEKIKSGKLLETLIVLVCSLVIFNNIIFANQQYTKSQIASQITHNELSNIARLIDENEEFDSQSQRVYFYGDLEESNYIFNKSYFDSYLTTFLNRNYDIPWALKAEDLFTEQEIELIKAIPTYPSSDCMIIINDILVVKLDVEK